MVGRARARYEIVDIATKRAAARRRLHTPPQPPAFSASPCKKVPGTLNPRPPFPPTSPLGLLPTLHDTLQLLKATRPPPTPIPPPNRTNPLPHPRRPGPFSPPHFPRRLIPATQNIPHHIPRPHLGLLPVRKRTPHPLLNLAPDRRVQTVARQHRRVRVIRVEPGVHAPGLEVHDLDVEGPQFQAHVRAEHGGRGFGGVVDGVERRVLD